MREILFRGKRVDNGEWVYGCYCPVVRGNFPATPCIVPDCDGMWEGIPIFPESVGQYTGLNDKNGNMIFVGDILKIYPDCDYLEDYSISKVYLYNGIPCVDYRGDDFDSTALGFVNDYDCDAAFEVIGNIYDNPELLEVE